MPTGHAVLRNNVLTITRDLVLVDYYEYVPRHPRYSILSEATVSIVEVDPWVAALLVHAPLEFTRQKSRRLPPFRFRLPRQTRVTSRAERRVLQMLLFPRRRRREDVA